jgi:hypothetical protein
MKIEERNAWQNKPHKTSKSRQKVNKVRMKIEERNTWQNKSTRNQMTINKQ